MAQENKFLQILIDSLANEGRDPASARDVSFGQKSENLNPRRELQWRLGNLFKGIDPAQLQEMLISPFAQEEFFSEFKPLRAKSAEIATDRKERFPDSEPDIIEQFSEIDNRYGQRSIRPVKRRKP